MLVKKEEHSKGDRVWWSLFLACLAILLTGSLETIKTTECSPSFYRMPK